MSAVIDKNAYTRIKSFINLAKSGIEGTQLVFGGKCDEAKGYFIEPTCIRVKNFKSRLLTNVFLIAYKNIHLSHFRTKSRKYLAQFWMYMFTMIKNAKQFLILLKMPLHMVIFLWTVFSSLCLLGLGLTGAIFAQDKLVLISHQLLIWPFFSGFIKHATDVLRDAVGNFYINVHILKIHDIF